MADPEGFLREDPTTSPNYLDDLVGGPKAMEHAGEVGAGAVAGEVHLDVADQSTGEQAVSVHTEQSASPFTAGDSAPGSKAT